MGGRDFSGLDRPPSRNSHTPTNNRIHSFYFALADSGTQDRRNLPSTHTQTIHCNATTRCQMQQAPKKGAIRKPAILASQSCIAGKRTANPVPLTLQVGPTVAFHGGSDRGRGTPRLCGPIGRDSPALTDAPDTRASPRITKVQGRLVRLQGCLLPYTVSSG